MVCHTVGDSSTLLPLSWWKPGNYSPASPQKGFGWDCGDETNWYFRRQKRHRGHWCSSNSGGQAVGFSKHFASGFQQSPCRPPQRCCRQARRHSCHFWFPESQHWLLLKLASLVLSMTAKFSILNCFLFAIRGFISLTGLVGRTEATLYNWSIKDFVGKTDLCNCWKGKIREAVTEDGLQHWGGSQELSASSCSKPQDLWEPSTTLTAYTAWSQAGAASGE